MCVWRISKTGKASLTYEFKADTGFTHCKCACFCLSWVL